MKKRVINNDFRIFKKIICCLIATLIFFGNFTDVSSLSKPDFSVGHETLIRNGGLDVLGKNVKIVDNSAVYGIKQGVYYRTFDKASGRYWGPFNNIVKLNDEDVNRNIIVKKRHVTTEDDVQKYAKGITEYQITFFPEFAIAKPASWGSGTDMINESSLGLVFSNDIELFDIGISVTHDDPGDSSTKNYGNINKAGLFTVDWFMNNQVKYNNAGGLDYKEHNYYFYPGIANTFWVDGNNKEHVKNHLINVVKTNWWTRGYRPNVMMRYNISNGIWDPGWWVYDLHKNVDDNGQDLSRAEFDLNSIGSALLWETGRSIQGDKHTRVKYDIYLRTIKKNDSNSFERVANSGPSNFSGIVAAVGNFDNNTDYSIAYMSGYKGEKTHLETTKILYREHFNSIGFSDGKSIPQRKTIYTRNNILTNRDGDSGSIVFSTNRITNPNTIIETELSMDTPLESANGISIQNYKSALNFIPDNINGFTTRSFNNGEKYQITEKIENGVKTFVVDVYYDADIIFAESVSNRPTGFYTLQYSAGDGGSFGANEATKFYVKGNSNKVFSDLSPHPVVTTPNKVFSHWNNFSTSTKMNDADNISLGNSIVVANYLSPITVDKPAVEHLSKYNTITFKSGVNATFENGKTEKIVYVLNKNYIGNKTFADLNNVIPSVNPKAGYINSEQLWKYDSNLVVNNSDVINDGNKIIVAQVVKDFDKDHLKKIEIINLKQDYWPNQYFAPEYPDHSLEIRLTDIKDKTEIVKYTDKIAVGGKQIPAFEYYNLSIYIPNDMKLYMREETVAGLNKIVLPSYEHNHMKIGVKWNTNDDIKVESDINGNYHDHRGPKDNGIFTFTQGLSGDFRIYAYKSDDITKKEVNRVVVNTPINVVIEYPSNLNNSSDKLIVDVPGISEKVTLYKTNIGGKTIYANVDKVGSQTFKALIPTVATLTSTLERVPNQNNIIKAFGKTYVLDVLPNILDRGSDTESSIEGNDDYVRIIFDAKEGSYTSNVKKKVYDVLKNLTWETFTNSYPVPSVIEPLNYSFIKYAPDLPSNETLISTLKTGEKNIATKKINYKEYSALYSKLPEITDKNPGDKDNQYHHVIFNAGDHGHFGSNEKTKEAWVLKTSSKTFDDVKTYLNLTLIEEDGWKNTSWNPELSSTIADGITSTTAQYTQLDEITDKDPGDGYRDQYAVVTYNSDRNGRVEGTIKLWVLKSANKKFVDLSKPKTVANEGYKFDSWSVNDDYVITEDINVLARFVKLDDILTEKPDNDIKEQYAKLTFTAGLNGKIEPSEKTLWIRKAANLKFKDISDKPNAYPNDGYKFTGWNIEENETIIVDRTATANFKALDEIVTVKPSDRLDQYNEITFNSGEHGSLDSSSTKTKKVWVLKTSSKTLQDAYDSAGISLVVEDGYKHTGWTPTLETSITKDETVTATYSELPEITTENPGDKINQYYKVTFKPGNYGKFVPDVESKVIFVIKNPVKNWSDIKASGLVPIVNPNSGYNHIGWSKSIDLNRVRRSNNDLITDSTVIENNSILTAEYSVQPTKPTKPTVDNITEGDDKVKVVPPTDADQINVKLPDNTVITVTKDKDGKWKLGDGTEVSEVGGKLEIPVDSSKINKGGSVVVTTTDTTTNLTSDEETKEIIARNNKTNDNLNIQISTDNNQVNTKLPNTGSDNLVSMYGVLMLFVALLFIRKGFKDN